MVQHLLILPLLVVRLQFLLLVHLWQWLLYWLLLEHLSCWCQNYTARATNQRSSGECFSCKEQIGVVGCPGVVDSSKTDRFPSVEPQHIDLYWCLAHGLSVLNQ